MSDPGWARARCPAPCSRVAHALVPGGLCVLKMWAALSRQTRPVCGARSWTRNPRFESSKCRPESWADWRVRSGPLGPPDQEPEWARADRLIESRGHDDCQLRAKVRTRRMGTTRAGAPPRYVPGALARVKASLLTSALRGLDPRQPSSPCISIYRSAGCSPARVASRRVIRTLVRIFGHRAVAESDLSVRRRQGRARAAERGVRSEATRRSRRRAQRHAELHDAAHHVGITYYRHLS